MAEELPALQSFVSGQLMRWLARRPVPEHGMASEDQEMVVWFADLSDFSRVTQEITERERAGPEVVTALLNAAFGSIIETIARHGGEVVGFAGDSVLATWAIDDHLDRETAVMLAARCGLDARELALPEVFAGHPPLRLRVGIGVGLGVVMQIGGVGGRWHFVMGGQPFDQIGHATNLGGSNDVVLSPEAWLTIERRARGLYYEGGFVKLASIDPMSHSVPVTALHMDAELRRRVKMFLPEPVMTRLDLGHGEWLAELRRVTSVFVNLPTLDTADPSARRVFQSVVETAQHSLARFEGTLSRILVDDKGVTIMASFGLPPLAHEEDPYRAIQAAEEIRGSLEQMKVDYGIGVATGRAYCGAYGSSTRREYTTIGREVNLAARLMRAARFEILCDGATARAARRVEFQAMNPVRVRGWDKPIDVFRPLWARAAPQAAQMLPASDYVPLIGRESESNQLTAWLGALGKAHASAVVVVEGEAGIGKSALAADLARTAKSFEVHTLVGAAQPVAQTPYHAWRDVFNDLLGLVGVTSIERRQDIVKDRLASWPQHAERAALLNAVLDLELPDIDATRGMTGSNRRDATVELLVAFLSEAAASDPLLIIIDDLHWFDSASWAVAMAVARKVSPLLLVLLTRPMIPQPHQMHELEDVGTSARLVLEPISRNDSLALVKDRLGVRELTPDVARVIVESAEGIPFFIEELAYSLRDSGAISIRDGVVELVRPVEELDVPHSVSSVVLSRIDRLSPELQLTVKVASVIGRSFDTEGVAAVHPDRPDVDELTRQLAQLVGRELIRESSPGSYDFKHALTRDAAYELLLYDQRRRIHRNVAAWIESQVEEPHEPPYALLAYHWDQSGDHNKALTYLEKSGASALRKGANREAIVFHSRSLDLVRENPEQFPEVTDLRRSQWHVEIGQAHEALGEFDQAEKSLYRGLDLVGVQVPASKFGRSGRLLWEMLKQFVHVAIPWAIRVPGSVGEKARLAQASRVAALIGEIYYFTGNLLGFPVLNLVAINLGERAGEPLVAGLAYSSLGYLAGTLRMRRLANRYFGRARIAEEWEVDPRLAQSPYALDLQEMGPGHLIAVSLSESVLALTFDEWDRAREIVTDGLERSRRMGDNYSAGIALAVRGFGSYSTGHLEEALGDYNQLLASARERSNLEHQGWATSFVIPVLLAFNRLDDAQSMAAEAAAVIGGADPLTVPVIHGTTSQVQMRMGLTTQARSSAESALEAIDSTPIFIYLAGFAGMLDTFLELWASEGDPASPVARNLANLTKRGVRVMRTFAWLLPFARPKYRLFRGRMEHLMGKPAKAYRTLAKGLELARRGGFTWDEGLLHFELARTMPTGSTERLTHFSEARKLFEKVGSRHDLDQVEAAGF